jgi:hypothetical protein
VRGEALISWVATAGVGLSLIGIWFGRGGLRRTGARRLTPQLLLTHIAPAVTGLLLWITFLITDEGLFAWMAFGILLVVALVGSIQFFIWQQRRAGVLKATKASWDLPPGQAEDQSLPAEQHFPVGAVVLHGLLAIVTVTFVLITAIDEEGEAEAGSPVSSGPAGSITATSASLQGTTGSQDARGRFEYGPTTAYGRSVPAQPAGGDGVTATLTRLDPATLHHYRLVVRHGDQTRRGGDRTFVTRPPGRVSLRLATIRPRRFRAGGPAALRFTLNSPATVRVGVYRITRRGPRTLFLRRSTVVVDGEPGPNVAPFGSRREVAALPPGPYKAVIVAGVSGGRPSAPVGKRFLIAGR